MHDDRSITEARLNRLLARHLRPAVFVDSSDFEVEVWEVPGEPVDVSVANEATFTPFRIGDSFARPWGTAWFHLRGAVPDLWNGGHVQAEIQLGYADMPGFTSEGLLWHRAPTGRWAPLRGIHPAAHHITLARPGVGGSEIDLLLEAAANPALTSGYPDPNSDIRTSGDAPIHRLTSARLVLRDDVVHALVHDVTVLRQLMRQLKLDAPHRRELLAALDSALDEIDLDDVPGTAQAARDALAEMLARPASPSAHRVSAIGHAHIDTAWLWPLRETRRKCGRTFANVLHLMREYPELRFACSQAAQYEWVRDDYPDVFEGIAERVASGEWLPVGGMWVEADTNLAGGEALLRQFVHGQRFFAEHFGVRCTETWLPDVFGYPASLPGIMVHAGIERFLTQKLSWNRTNRFPHHTFRWEGIDGSTVFTHFPPVETYNATLEAHELIHSVRTFAEHGRATRSLMPFGWGDGGGGPSADMMETFRRSRDLEGLPRLEIESPERFFDAAMEEYPDAPRWVGELYFEMHRGTFTSQAATKAGNRRCERLLREAELFATWATVMTGEPARYPIERLDRLWKDVLLHQFHDILPGSSIGWVHREAVEFYDAATDELGRIVDDALAAIGSRSGGPLVANAASHDRTEVVLVAAGVFEDIESVEPSADDVPDDVPDGVPDAAPGAGVVTQTVGDRRAVVVRAPACGVAPLRPVHSRDATALEPVAIEPVADGFVISNEHLSVRIDSSGGIASLACHGGPELIAPGHVANRLELHPDVPNEFDAWDIEAFNRRKRVVLAGDELTSPATLDVVANGPLIVRIVVSRSFRSSTITQTFELRAGSPRLDVVNEVDWRESEKLLQVAFPFDVHTLDMTRGIQFGHLRSAIHTNTSWDAARFEVCAHRWVDVSERGRGVALLNDAKYGHHAERDRTAGDRPMTTLYQTLLRGSRYPDPQQDVGRHVFTWALMPHGGDALAAGVIHEAERLNIPLRVTASCPDGAGHGPAIGAMGIAAGSDALVVEAVKLADDGSGDVVVRCYESHGSRLSTSLTPDFAAVDAWTVDAHESVPDRAERLASVSWDGNAASVALTPFQIATVRFRR